MEHSEQDSQIMPTFLFHLFRLFLSFHGTEQNKAVNLAEYSVPLVLHKGWNGTNMHGRKDHVREARKLREMRECRPMWT